LNAVRYGAELYEPHRPPMAAVSEAISNGASTSEAKIDGGVGSDFKWCKHQRSKN